MLKVSAGEFLMGSESPNAYDRERPIHEVQINHPYFLCDREVTVGQFLQFIHDAKYPISEKPQHWQGPQDSVSPTPNHPIQNVNWNAAVMFCNWLSRREGRIPYYERGSLSEGRAESNWIPKTGVNGYRLPTEAEWEFACRAGTQTDYAFGNQEKYLADYAVFRSQKAEPCGSLYPNSWGFFDLAGNVYEWCGDTYRPYSTSPANNLVPPREARDRVARSSAWNDVAVNCRSTCRHWFEPEFESVTLGFRVTLNAESN